MLDGMKLGVLLSTTTECRTLLSKTLQSLKIMLYNIMNVECRDTWNEVAKEPQLME